MAAASCAAAHACLDLSVSKVAKLGNAPAAYDFDANAAYLNQATACVRWLPGTVQNVHVDRGCRIIKVHGTDYRCTTMYGLASNRFLEHNRWAGPGGLWRRP